MNKELLDLILAQLAEDFPDTAKTYSAEVFADWLTKYQFESDLQTACLDALLEGQRKAGLSPTGRLPSQPELQHLPRSYQLPAMKMTEERAKELLQQYRDTFPVISAPWLTPGYYPNFPCVAVDLASGVDYSVEQHPIQADHASVDDKGNVSVSIVKKPCHHMYINGRCMACREEMPKYNPGHYLKEALFAPYTTTAEQVVQQERNGAHWGNMTADEIYKDIAEVMLNWVRTPVESLIRHRLTKNWTISQGSTTVSYAPHSAVDIPVLVVSELLDNGVVEVVESCQGEAAVKRARYYLVCFEAGMKR